MDYVPKEIPEGINVTRIHPLKYLAKVAAIIFTGLVIFYGVSGIIAVHLTNNIDPQLEAAIGQSLVSSLGEIDIRPDQTRQLQQLVDELQKVGETRLPKAKVHLLESSQVNAGVLPGGQMVVTTGLIDEAKSENELAFVLGHELGHHQFRHPSQSFGRSLLWMIGMSLLGLGQQTTTFNPSAPLQFANLQFSRAQEQVSDEFALALVQKRYGHVAHALDFFRRLEQQNLDPIARKLQLEFLSTHPFPKNRIQDLERYARKQNWPVQGEQRPLSIEQ